jgi:predicted ATP-binding protein involved in virulence
MHPRLTVLVAENGGGKTTILDGIAKGLAPVLRFLSSPEQHLSATGLGLDDNDFRLLSDTEKNRTNPQKQVLLGSAFYCLVGRFGSVC